MVQWEMVRSKHLPVEVAQMLYDWGERGRGSKSVVLGRQLSLGREMSAPRQVAGNRGLFSTRTLCIVTWGRGWLLLEADSSLRWANRALGLLTDCLEKAEYRPRRSSYANSAATRPMCPLGNSIQGFLPPYFIGVKTPNTLSRRVIMALCQNACLARRRS